MRKLALGVVVALITFAPALAAGRQSSVRGEYASGQMNSAVAAETLRVRLEVRHATPPAFGIHVASPGAPEPWIGPQRLRHTLYGAIAGVLVGGAAGIIASNVCKAGLCQNGRVGVTVAAAGVSAFLGALVGFSLPASDP